MEQAERAKSFNDNHLLQKFLLFRVAFLNSLGLQLLHESVACKRLACCGGFSNSNHQLYAASKTGNE